MRHKDVWAIRYDEYGCLYVTNPVPGPANSGSFVNTISQICQREPPHELNGGIIADPMGLGKTLTMIALVAMDADSQDVTWPEAAQDSSKYRVPTTLIIVPPSRECSCYTT